MTKFNKEFIAKTDAQIDDEVKAFFGEISARDKKLVEKSLETSSLNISEARFFNDRDDVSTRFKSGSTTLKKEVGRLLDDLTVHFQQKRHLLEQILKRTADNRQDLKILDKKLLKSHVRDFHETRIEEQTHNETFEKKRFENDVREVKIFQNNGLKRRESFKISERRYTNNFVEPLRLEKMLTKTLEQTSRSLERIEDIQKTLNKTR